MIKRILILLALIATSVYLVLAVTMFNAKPLDRPCEGMELEIMDDIDYEFITLRDIETIFKNKKLLPTGKKQKDINVRSLETELEKNPFVKDAECYITKGGKVKIDVYQRIPLMRVMSSNEGNEQQRRQLLH